MLKEKPNILTLITYILKNILKEKDKKYFERKG
jgi:hypothetical protein